MSPNGQTHFSWWKRFMPVVAIVCFGLGLYINHFDFAAVMFLGYLVGYFIDPDLDQISITSAEGRMLRNLGCLGAALVAYWFPYSFVMPHRSFLSHGLFIGTLLRLVYLLLIPGVIYFVWSYYYNEGVFLYLDYISCYLFALFGGLSVSDAVHIMLDEVVR